MTTTASFTYGLIVGGLIGMACIALLLWFIEENRYYNQGWKQAEIYHMRTDTTKYQYKLLIDSTYKEIK